MRVAHSWELYGIPIAHKDLFETMGVRTTAGSLLFEEYIPDNNAAIVQQLETPAPCCSARPTLTSSAAA